jgi:hypothetical protein
MTTQPIISRRLLLAGLWLAGSRSVWAQAGGDDRGIGGTGVLRRDDDRGIGGTGIVGVIQRFGSIFVNGERVSYAPDVRVQIDGALTSARALRIGQTARVLATRQPNGALTTRGIDVVSEVVGPIENVNAGEITVLGQRVISAGSENWRRPGVQVAVFGLRRTDGAIVASLVVPGRDNAARVAGPLERDRRGALRIGGLRLDGVNAALAGQRVQAEGRVVQGVMQVSRAKADDFSDLAGARRLLIEAYVRRVGSDLQFGSGYVARDLSRFRPSAGEARVVVDAVLDSATGLRVESVRSVSSFPGASMQVPRGPDQGPGPGGGAPGPFEPNDPDGQGGGPGGGQGHLSGSHGNGNGNGVGNGNAWGPGGLGGGGMGGGMSGGHGGGGGGGLGGGVGGGRR